MQRQHPRRGGLEILASEGPSPASTASTASRHTPRASLVPALICLVATAPFLPAAGGVESFRRQVEDDWVLQEAYRAAPVASGPVSTAQDAAGGCDGVRDGTYGFHTGLSDAPWWQVDLGAAMPLDRVVVWNRGDGAGERSAHLSLLLSSDGTEWTTAFEQRGAPFGGAAHGKPLEISLEGKTGRFVRVRVPDTTYLHLDEIEVFARAEPERNVALGRPADQVSTSQWSRSRPTSHPMDWVARARDFLELARRRSGELREAGRDPGRALEAIDGVAARLDSLPPAGDARDLYLEARWIHRGLLLSHPLLDFDAILFVKRVPGSFNHMSDQYLGWWSRPGGGLHVLRGYRDDAPTVEPISGAFTEPGSFLRPDLSHDGKRLLFAWCRHYPGLEGEPNKLDKDNVPEDAFYHIYEVGLDGREPRRLTRGKYDNFDARYLPDGRIAFLSTRRGQSVRVGRESARLSMEDPDRPDVYVRCGGGPERPCAVYTLHTMGPDGGDLRAISPFEMFEWTPSVAHDGTLLYSRWDYVDRDNMPYMSLWSIRPDGTNARLVYGNFTRAPHCTFEPRAVPGSRKIIFTASAHHDQTKGSLVLLDPAVGDEGEAPIVRLTPEVSFPEIEGWPASYYAGPWPLSESLYLVAWGDEGTRAPPRTLGWDRWHLVPRPRNGMGLYLFHSDGAMELLYRDPEISSVDPLPVRPRPVEHRVPDAVAAQSSREGSFLLADVRRGLRTVGPGEIRSLRIVAVPAKTHPTMNFPSLGVTSDDPGKCVLGTVPVEEDGSAYFRVPAGVIVFFQALDGRGMAVQTMRSATHVQPGQVLGCVGCHEPRSQTPTRATVLAARREPSRIQPGPDGSWPLRFDRLVQPVLDRRCLPCHDPAHQDGQGAGSSRDGKPSLDLTPARAYESLVSHGAPSLEGQVRAAYRRGYSVEGDGIASRSALLAMLTGPEGHHGVALDTDDLERLIVWMDTYAQRLGSFGPEQEQDLENLRRESEELMAAGR